jgi:hypothetical protein
MLSAGKQNARKKKHEWMNMQIKKNSVVKGRVKNTKQTFRRPQFENRTRVSSY